jgi:hypothetical protein
MRKTVFISHGDSPKDNDFTKWLALKLIGLGYDVWCDILFLDKGVDFWKQIDSELRSNTCKFICVLSSFSNRREGVLKELAVAEKVKKQLNDETFIIPVAIDQNLSYDDINIELLRLNAINFKNSWATGLRDLLEAFSKQSVPCSSPNASRSNLLFQQIFLHDKTVIEGEELYDSNWFSVQSFPDELRFHDYDWRLPKDVDVSTLKFPAVRFKNFLVTFAWAYDFIEELPKTEAYENSRTVSIPVSEILAGQIKNAGFLYPSTGQRLIVDLTNQAITRSFGKRDLRQYQMSHRIGYWIERGKLEKNKYKNVQLLGKALSNTWHFGISAAAKLYPMPVLTISSHIYFTTNGIDLIESDSIQHTARRKQGKNWWNETWRKKLLAFVDYLSEENVLILEVGSEERIIVESTPNQFLAKVTYAIPSKNTLSEEAEIANIHSINEIDEHGEEIRDLE